MRKVFEGVGTALVTPFIDGRIDFVSLKNMIENQIECGVSAIVILATTGEGSTIDDKEREEIIIFSKNVIKSRVKLIVGAGDNNSKNAVRKVLQAKFLGADAVLVVTPYYNKTTQQGIIDYYTMLSEIEIPIIIYNVPSRTGLNIDLDTIKKLIKNPFIYGIKESTHDISRIMSLIKICKNKMAVYSGEDDLNFLFYCLGATGCLSVLSNLYPKKVKELFDYVKNHVVFKANKLNSDLYLLNKSIFIETNPVPIKYLLNKENLIRSNEVRLPLITLSTKSQKMLDKTINNYKKKQAI